MRGFVAAVAFMLASVSLSHGAVVFDNGGPKNSGIATASDFDSSLTGQEVANDFVLSAGGTTVSQVNWWGVYAANDTPLATDDFIVRIFADAGGVPAVSPLFDYAVGNAVGRTDTGGDFGSFDIYAYSAFIPATTLPAGTTFWLSVVNDTTADTNDDWQWVNTFATTGNPGAFRFNNGAWGPTSVDHAFNLTDAVPEPTGVAALCAAAVCHLRRPRRRRGAR